MGFDAWLAAIHWAGLTLGCALGVFGILGLTTRFVESRWQHRRGGVRAGRMIAGTVCLMSLFLIMKSSTSLFPFPHWLEVVLVVAQFCCFGGYLWLYLAARRIGSHDDR
ncbi:hypothetical protein [Nonomuraea sediminis]|uniref:hypothetical protein n=1 Tax=Nonomuraea sediminis TaxID=2835864 RepID=UPI001BDD71BB|nr:hypothetical protein [Nonomuraea sediminis]